MQNVVLAVTPLVIYRVRSLRLLVPGPLPLLHRICNKVVYIKKAAANGRLFYYLWISYLVLVSRIASFIPPMAF